MLYAIMCYNCEMQNHDKPEIFYSLVGYDHSQLGEVTVNFVNYFLSTALTILNWNDSLGNCKSFGGHLGAIAI